MDDLLPQATEPDLALLYLASFFETLDCTPPERDEAKLDALAWLILDKRPKTLLGLAIRARAEKHLCRYLWTVDFERLPAFDQATRVVIEAMLLAPRRPSQLIKSPTRRLVDGGRGLAQRGCSRPGRPLSAPVILGSRFRRAPI